MTTFEVAFGVLVPLIPIVYFGLRAYWNKDYWDKERLWLEPPYVSPTPPVHIEYVGQHQTGSVYSSAARCFGIHCIEDFTQEKVRYWLEHNDGCPDPLTRYTPLLSFRAVWGDKEISWSSSGEVKA